MQTVGDLQALFRRRWFDDPWWAAPFMSGESANRRGSSWRSARPTRVTAPWPPAPGMSSSSSSSDPGDLSFSGRACLAPPRAPRLFARGSAGGLDDRVDRAGVEAENNLTPDGVELPLFRKTRTGERSG